MFRVGSGSLRLGVGGVAPASWIQQRPDNPISLPLWPAPNQKQRPFGERMGSSHDRAITKPQVNKVSKRL